jgi:polyvinyl alcohol dehydrogenase (cytochrome)
MFEAEGGVRTAISIGETKTGGLAAYFGDARGYVYAVDPANGKLHWKVKIDDQPGARLTGAPTLYNGRLYVPVTPGEEGAAARPDYECCKGRGLVAALDALTGKPLWKTYTIPEGARKTQKNRVGTQLWGPSGAGVWSAPTVDVKRKTIYVATGNNYSLPPTDTSDAILALDMDSGQIKWSRQVTPGDTWNVGCNLGRDSSNCPDPEDPDFDFGASPILVELGDGRQLVLAGQKSGVVYALDPDQEGTIVWEQRVGKGGVRGGIEWGPAADNDMIYAAVSDAVRLSASAFDPYAGGGLTALEIASGKKIWYASPAPCGDRRPCIPAQEAAVTVIPGVVFSGSMDGHLRAYSTRDGRVLWDYDTVREYTTVNGVTAKGGSIGNGGVAVVDGMLFTNSGYSNVMPGNVLLAFSAD